MLKARTKAECEEQYRVFSARDPNQEAPTYFECRPLSANTVLACDGQSTVSLRRWWAFRYGVLSITGLDCAEPWAPEFDDEGVLKGPCVSELAERIGMDVVQEIGGAILARAHGVAM